MLAKDYMVQIPSVDKPKEVVEDSVPEIESIEDRLFSNDNKSQAIMLLGRGFKDLEVSNLLGISPSLISQYKQDKNFCLQVEELAAERRLAITLRDDAIDKLEELAIEKATDALSFYLKPMESITALEKINRMQRRSVAPIAEVGNESNTIRLTLPSGMRNTIIQMRVNSSNEVVEVEGRELRTAGVAEVGRNLEQFKEVRNTKLLEQSPNKSEEDE